MLLVSFALPKAVKNAKKKALKRLKMLERLEAAVTKQEAFTGG
jgi:hypothetical protein